MILRPVVQFKIGDSDITTIPPNYLIRFTYISQRQLDEVNIEFIDPTFGELEDKFIGSLTELRTTTGTSKQKHGIAYFRWGYPDNGLDQAKWRGFTIRSFTPNISIAGMRLQISAWSTAIYEATSFIEPKEYRGKVSDVARAIAKDLGFSDDEIFVEETDDVSRSDTDNVSALQVENGSLVGTEAIWFTGIFTKWQFLHYVLLKRAQSSKVGTWVCGMTSDHTFHFHRDGYSTKNDSSQSQNPLTSGLSTETLKQDVSNQKSFRLFMYLFGQNNTVTSFTPEYRTSGGASVGPVARACLASTYDPRTKQLVQEVYDAGSLGINEQKNLAPKGSATKPNVITDSTDLYERSRVVTSQKHVPSLNVAFGGRCSGREKHQHNEPVSALNQVKNGVLSLQALVGAATMVLVGLPELVDFMVYEQYCDVVVVKPNGERHWSSGRYYLKTITHDIASTYSITCVITTYAVGVGLAKIPHVNKESIAQPEGVVLKTT